MRQFLVAAAAASMATGMFAAPADAAAGGELTDITCHGGSFNAQFNPGITFKKQTFQIQGNADLGICNSASNSKITGGTVRFVGSATGNCPGPLGVGNGKAQITWNTGESSIIANATFRGEAFTWSVQGTVTEGLGKGLNGYANGRSTTSTIDMGAQCVTSGLSNYSGNVDTGGLGGI